MQVKAFIRRYATNPGSYRHRSISEGLDHTTRVKILKEEYQLNWGIGNYPSPEQSKIIKFQEKNAAFRAGTYNPSGNEKEVFVLQQRLALSAYHRAILKCPSLVWLVKNEIDPCVVVRNNKKIYPVFTSSETYQEFAKSGLLDKDHKAIPNYGTSVNLFRSGQFDELVVDPSPDFKSNLGSISGPAQWQQMQIQFIAYYGRTLLADLQFNDSLLKDMTFWALFSKTHSGQVYVSGTGLIQLVYLSDIHRDVTMHKLGDYEKLPMLWKSVLANWQGLPPNVVGLTLDRLPEEWEIFAGRDCNDDKLDVHFKIFSK